MVFTDTTYTPTFLVRASLERNISWGRTGRTGGDGWCFDPIQAAVGILGSCPSSSRHPSVTHQPRVIYPGSQASPCRPTIKVRIKHLMKDWTQEYTGCATESHVREFLVVRFSQDCLVSVLLSTPPPLMFTHHHRK